MTFNQSLPTANRACGSLPHAYNLGNKNPPCGGFFTVTLAARIALVTPNTHAASIEICDLLI